MESGGSVSLPFLALLIQSFIVGLVVGRGGGALASWLGDWVRLVSSPLRSHQAHSWDDLIRFYGQDTVPPLDMTSKSYKNIESRTK